MTLQTDQPIQRLNLQAYNRSVAEFIPRDRDDYELNPPYQRGTVWTPDQRVALVHSFLSGTPIPAVILNYRANDDWTRANGALSIHDPAYAVVDGKQRIETIRAWFDGLIAVPASWFDPELVKFTESTSDGQYVNYTGLSIVGQRTARMWTIPTAEARVASVEDEAAIYLRVNGGGTAQSAADMANAEGVRSRTGVRDDR